MPSWTKEQLSAIETTGSNIIVSAGAGSGKTAVLSERVIHHLKKGIKINELLILTFTTAAAGEMQDRIRSKIADNPDLKDNLDLLESSYITTFDAYCLSLVKKYSYILNVSPSLSIVDDGFISIYKEKILDEIFDEYYLKKDDKFCQLIDDFCIKNDTEIKQDILSIIDSLSQKVNQDEYLDNYLNNYYNEEYRNDLISKYMNLIYEEMQNIETNICLISDSGFSDFADELSQKLGNLIRSKEYDDLKKNIDITLPRLPKDSEEIKSFKESIINSISKIKTYLRFNNLEDIYASFIISKNYVEVIIDIIKEFNQRLNKYKHDNDLYEFIDIELMAITLLKDNEEIQNELKNYYKEIMIDEYQDTNDIQEEFVSLIENNNVYMVGDIKQSIYGFRNANPIIFKNKYDKYAQNDGGVKIDLLKNFRSRSNVLNGINEVFNLIMDDDFGGANYIKDHQMVYGNHTYDTEAKQDYDLELLCYAKETLSNEETEAFIIADDILNKIKNNYQVMDKKTGELRTAKYSDFCIIMDRGSAFSTYKKIFEYKKLPLNVYEDRKLTNEVDILLLKNIYTLILKIKDGIYDTAFKYAFVAVSRSCLFELNDNDILKTINSHNYQETIVYQKGLNIVNKLDYMNAYDLLKQILKEFNFYENILKLQNIDDILIRVDNLLKVASNLSINGYDYLKFYDYLCTMIDSDYEIKYKESSADTDSIKLMNIHKSKGLEFPVCYFSGFYKEYNKRDIKEKFLFDNVYGLITPYFKEGIGSLITKDLLTDKYTINDVSEKIRLLYVALTRAKEKMIIIIPREEEEPKITVKGVVDNVLRKRYNSFLDIIKSINGNLERYVQVVDLSKIGLSKKYLTKNQQDLTITKDDKTINFKTINVQGEIIEQGHASKKINELISKEEKELLAYGTKVHEAFELVDFFDYPNDFPYQKELENLKKKLSLTEDTKIYKEYEFMDEEENIHGFIDLLLIEKDLVKIVDYKLKNIDDEAYQKQLKVYKKYLQKIMDKDIKCYLYSIMTGELKEVK